MKGIINTVQDDSIRINKLNILILSYFGNNLDSAERYTQLYYEIVKDKGRPRRLARAYALFAELAERKNNPSEQIKNLSEALKLMDKVNDKDGMIKVYFKMAFAYVAMNDAKNALKYVNKSQELITETGEKFARINQEKVFHALGLVARLKKDFVLAEKYLEMALSGISGVKIDKWYVANLHHDLAVCKDSLHNFDAAKKNYTIAHDLFVFLDDLRGVSKCKLGMAGILREKNLNEKSLRNLLSSEALALRSRNYQGLVAVYRALADHYKLNGNLKLQLFYFEQYTHLNDSLRQVMYDQNLATANARFGAEEKERENQILNEKNISLQLQEQNIRNRIFLISTASLLIISAVLFIAFYARLKSQKRRLELEYHFLSNQMNPHFIYNSLSAVQSLALSEPPMGVVKHISRLSRLIRAVFENSKKELISLKEETDMLNLYLELEVHKISRNISYAVEVGNDVSPELKIPPMLIQPFVENSLKHAFLGRDENADNLVKVTITKSGRDLMCVVEDNGNGINKTERATDAGTVHESSGIKVTEDRLRLLCSKYKCRFSLSVLNLKNEDPLRNGTRIEFVLPHKELLQKD